MMLGVLLMAHQTHGVVLQYNGLISSQESVPVTGVPRATSAVASVDHAAGGNLGAELAQAKRREAEATTRVAALEAKLKSSSSVHGEMQASVQELSHRLQVPTTAVGNLLCRLMQSTDVSV